MQQPLDTSLIKPQIKDYERDIWSSNFQINVLDEYFPIIFCLRFYGLVLPGRFTAGSQVGILDNYEYQLRLYHKYDKNTFIYIYQEALKFVVLSDKNNFHEDYHKGLVRLYVLLLLQPYQTINEKENQDDYQVGVAKYSLLYNFLYNSKYSGDFAIITQDEVELELKFLTDFFSSKVSDIKFLIQENVSHCLDNLYYFKSHNNSNFYEIYYIGHIHFSTIQPNFNQNTLVEKSFGIMYKQFDFFYGKELLYFDYHDSLWKMIDCNFWYIIRQKTPNVYLPIKQQQLIKFYRETTLTHLSMIIHKSYTQISTFDNYLDSYLHFNKISGGKLLELINECKIIDFTFFLIIYLDKDITKQDYLIYIRDIEVFINKSKKIDNLALIIYLLLIDYQNIISKKLNNSLEIKNIIKGFLEKKINNLNLNMNYKLIEKTIKIISKFNYKDNYEQNIIIDKNYSKEVKKILQNSLSKCLSIM